MFLRFLCQGAAECTRRQREGDRGEGWTQKLREHRLYLRKKSRTGQTGGRAEQAEVSVCLSVRPLVVTSLCFSVGLSPSVCRSVSVSVSVCVCLCVCRCLGLCGSLVDF